MERGCFCYKEVIQQPQTHREAPQGHGRPVNCCSRHGRPFVAFTTLQSPQVQTILPLRTELTSFPGDSYYCGNPMFLSLHSVQGLGSPRTPPALAHWCTASGMSVSLLPLRHIFSGRTCSPGSTSPESSGWEIELCPSETWRDTEPDTPPCPECCSLSSYGRKEEGRKSPLEETAHFVMLSGPFSVSVGF